jgi:hypothetical protein
MARCSAIDVSELNVTIAQNSDREYAKTNSRITPTCAENKGQRGSNAYRDQEAPTSRGKTGETRGNRGWKEWYIVRTQMVMWESGAYEDATAGLRQDKEPLRLSDWIT